MLDLRFYEALGPVTVRALAPSADIGGDTEHLVSGVSPADRAGAGDVCFYEPKGGVPLASAPGACVIRPAVAHLAPNATALILTDAPRPLFARIASLLARPRTFTSAAAIDPSARIDASARISPGVVVGADAQIGADASIGPNAVIGPGVTIGRRAKIGAGVSIAFALLGDDVTIFAGTVIGEAGFGIAGDASGLIDIPHLGRVIIQDGVSIGSNCAIDRGLFDDTIIGENSKLDNLCHIGHNVVIGRRAQIAGFAGISGSTIVGDGVIMGGRVGIGDHRTIGAGAVLAGASAVLQDVPAGETWSGYPAKPLRKWLREAAWVSRKAGARNGE